jgi:hypothetical protein
MRSCPWLAPGPRRAGRDPLRLRLAAPAPSPCRPPRGVRHESLAFLEFPCPSTFEQMQRPLADSTCVSSSSHRGYLPDFAASSGFRNPSTLHSATCLPALFRAGAVHGLSSLRRFLPARSPANLSVPGLLRAVIPLARNRLRGCQHRPDACRRFVGLALTAFAPPLVVSPLRGLYLPVSLRASASLLSWAFSWAPSDRSALRLRDPRASQRALQSFREPEGRLRLSPGLPPWGLCLGTGSRLAAGGPCLAPRGRVLGS